MSKDSILDPKAAKVGFVVCLASVLLALAFPLFPSSVHNSIFLLFLASGGSSVPGILVLLNTLKPSKKLNAVAALVIVLLVSCFGLAIAGWTESVRLTAQSFGVVISVVTFFSLAGNLDDFSINSKKEGLLAVAWFVNGALLLAVALIWAFGHLQETGIVSASFMAAYALLPSSKYISLSKKCVHGEKKAQAMLGTFAILSLVLGWVYFGTLLGGFSTAILNSAFFAGAGSFGFSYCVDGLLRKGATQLGEESTQLDWRQFLGVMAFQAALMVTLGIIGTVGGTTPLLVGVLAQESLPNLLGAYDLFKTLHLEESGLHGWSRVGMVFAFILGVAIVVSFMGVFIPQLTSIGGGLAISIFQGVPWMQVALHGCLRRARRPARAFRIFILSLIAATVVCVVLSIWVAGRGYGPVDLVEVWYSLTRLITGVSLGCYGLVSLGSLGESAPQNWRKLLIGVLWIIALGSGWFVIALVLGGIGASIAPSAMLQIVGGLLIAVVYPAFNSSSFRHSG